MKILTEASGSPVAAFMIKAIQEAGHTAIASDIDEDNAGRYLADDFVRVPAKDDPQLWPTMEKIVRRLDVDVVIPSLDETLMGWSLRKDDWRSRLGVCIVISPPPALEIFGDKWATYQFFLRHDIPTARTSLTQDYPLVKPRRGRGAQGVALPTGPVGMDGMISQEVLTGQEYTVDVLCDRDSKPVYIVPRRRLRVTGGKSMNGLVERCAGLTPMIRKICRLAGLQGPVNFQCFIKGKGKPPRFTEVNPRIAGGMALSFAATRNWVPLIMKHFVHGCALTSGPVRYGTRMYRYYAECFVSRH